MENNESVLKKMGWKATALLIGVLVFGFIVGCIYTLWIVKGL